jgi:peptidoglycan hydrolase-like protein with peptidoglycan-binding domain
VIKFFVKTMLVGFATLLAAAAGFPAPKPAKHPIKPVATKKSTTPARPAMSAAAKTNVSKTAVHSTSHHATRHHKTPRIRGQAAPTADRISQIQTALAKSGAYGGDPTGKWDDSSVSAMKKFQQQNGLEPSGKLDALTLQKLGLGSDVAGRAAPRPITASRSASSSSSFER